MTTNRSESVTELFTALAAAQGEFPAIPKNCTARGMFGGKDYKYADLDSVISACVPIMSKHGLSLFQPPVSTDGARVTLQTILAHKSGEFWGGEMTLTANSASTQDVGSALTYLRRYSWTAMLGVATECDTDGVSPHQNPRRRQLPEVPKQGLTDELKGEFKDALARVRQYGGDPNSCYGGIAPEKVRDLPPGKLREILTRLTVLGNRLENEDTQKMGRHTDNNNKQRLLEKLRTVYSDAGELQLDPEGILTETLGGITSNFEQWSPESLARGISSIEKALKKAQ